MMEWKNGEYEKKTKGWKGDCERKLNDDDERERKQTTKR